MTRRYACNYSPNSVFMHRQIEYISAPRCITDRRR